VYLKNYKKDLGTSGLKAKEGGHQLTAVNSESPSKKKPHLLKVNAAILDRHPHPEYPRIIARLSS